MAASSGASKGWAVSRKRSRMISVGRHLDPLAPSLRRPLSQNFWCQPPGEGGEPGTPDSSSTTRRVGGISANVPRHPGAGDLRLEPLRLGRRNPRRGSSAIRRRDRVVGRCCRRGWRAARPWRTAASQIRAVVAPGPQAASRHRQNQHLHEALVGRPVFDFPPTGLLDTWMGITIGGAQRGRRSSHSAAMKRLIDPRHGDRHCPR